VGCITVTELTGKLLTSYASVGGINHLDGANLPSKAAIAQITQDLLRLVFPGFFDERTLHSSELKIEITMLMDSVLERLEAESLKSINYYRPDELDADAHRNAAQEATCQFLASLPSIREVLQTDAEAAFNGDPAALSKEEVIVAYPFMEAIAVQRMAHELYVRDVALIPRIMTEWSHARTGIDLHPGAKIGTHFFIDHGTGTVVGETCTIGNYVKLYHNVGLVARSLAAGQKLRGKKRHPTVEDRVTIYAGATIVGGDTVIGKGSTIGGNVFLMESVPPESLVLYDNGRSNVVAKRSKSAPEMDFQI
jgi:serine O-acetyltransferase